MISKQVEDEHVTEALRVNKLILLSMLIMIK